MGASSLFCDVNDKQEYSSKKISSLSLLSVLSRASCAHVFCLPKSKNEQIPQESVHCIKFMQMCHNISTELIQCIGPVLCYFIPLPQGFQGCSLFTSQKPVPSYCGFLDQKTQGGTRYGGFISLFYLYSLNYYYLKRYSRSKAPGVIFLSVFLCRPAW